MIIKKTNACLSLLTALVLLLHTAFQTFSYLTLYYNKTLSAASGIALSAVICLHAVFSAVSIFVLHDSKTVRYKRLNIKTVLQRVSAVLMLFLMPVHFRAFSLLQNSVGSFSYCLIEACQLLFFASLFCHFALSFTNSLVTLGRLDDIDKKRFIDRILWVICSLLFAALSVIITVTHLTVIH